MQPPAGDPINDVIHLLRPEAILSAGLLARGRWGIRFEGYPHVKFGTIVAGHCVILVEGRRRAVRCEAGDVYLLGNPPAYVMASDLQAPRLDAKPLFSDAIDGVVTLGAADAGPATHIVGGHFIFDPSNAHLLMNALPLVLRVPAAAAGPLRELSGLLVRELAEQRAGRKLVLDHLAQLILVHAMRSADVGGVQRRASWLRALADPQIGLALRHIHADVGARFSLDDLAATAGMSRSALALRFKQLVGRPPLDYAIAWRMDLARDALRTTDRAVGELAFALGYASESAFSAAFRRVVGTSPRAYRQEARATAVRRNDS
ncbi:AraC family transcriptional regulator [Chondromyces apiculatus]|uniref:Transcriptional regulator, AraC family n=1 Tax=Chondromyces apiculatus DSM 436 TaxID=1192034 RepID=A0A017TG73_9BACT|nr:AraC family transcriptional regulator [Chondromyces apiculatus]EYF08244.1 Transcriptional regulator, AraC family [Chondromyces apiculatus DSM 436]